MPRNGALVNLPGKGVFKSEEQDEYAVAAFH